MAGVVLLAPGGADDGVVLTELLGTELQVRGGLALPVSNSLALLLNSHQPYLLERHLVHEPEGEGGRPHGAQVGECVEEGHVGGAHHRVTDTGKEGHETQEHAVQGDPVGSEDDGHQDVVEAGETFILQLEQGGDVNLRQSVSTGLTGSDTDKQSQAEAHQQSAGEGAHPGVHRLGARRVP